jgi:hypothetical protein
MKKTFAFSNIEQTNMSSTVCPFWQDISNIKYDVVSKFGLRLNSFIFPEG